MMRQTHGRRPTHPGVILREDILPETGLTQGELAERLGVSRRTVNEITQERRPITTDMACRLAVAFGNSPEFWLNMQQAVDLYEARQEHAAEYAHIARVAVAGT